ncbi:hypothetical protein C8R45DRAFT_935013 [Mycena sanguinolenta]|nr:hypothetical protein C8R45DRAFT_935013 [Mycena sanguinolenta]
MHPASTEDRQGADEHPSDSAPATHRYTPLSCSLPASPPPTPVAPARRFGDHLPRVPPELSKSLEYSEYTSPDYQIDRGPAHFRLVYEWRCEEEDIKHEFGQKYAQDPPHADCAAATPQFLKDNRRLNGYLACAHACLLIRGVLLSAHEAAQAFTDTAVASLSTDHYLHAWLADIPKRKTRHGQKNSREGLQRGARELRWVLGRGRLSPTGGPDDRSVCVGVYGTWDTTVLSVCVVVSAAIQPLHKILIVHPQVFGTWVAAQEFFKHSNVIGVVEVDPEP